MSTWFLARMIYIRLSHFAQTGTLSGLQSYGSVPSVFGQAGSSYAILTGGNGIWGAGGEHFDQYGAIYNPKAAGPTSTITVEVTAQQAVDPWSKAGLVVRDDVTGTGTSQGYAVLVVTQVLSLLQSAALAWVAFTAVPGEGTVWLIAEPSRPFRVARESHDPRTTSPPAGGCVR